MAKAQRAQNSRCAPSTFSITISRLRVVKQKQQNLRTHNGRRSRTIYPRNQERAPRKKKSTRTTKHPHPRSPCHILKIVQKGRTTSHFGHGVHSSLHQVAPAQPSSRTLHLDQPSRRTSIFRVALQPSTKSKTADAFSHPAPSAAAWWCHEGSKPLKNSK